MRTYLYRLLLFVSKAILPIAAWFNPKVKRFYLGQKFVFNNIEEALSNNSNELFWVHCSSVGEFEQGLPVIELLKKEYPQWKVVVTFFSPSGFEAINSPVIDYKFYLPIDTKSNANRFLKLTNPKMAIFIKYEFWYHYLQQLKQKSIPIFSVSSIFRATQAFFKPFGGWNRKMLNSFTYFMVQDQQSLDLLKNIHINNAEITGDTRFDRVLKLKQENIQFANIDEFVKGKKVFIIGSLRPEDDTTVFSFIASQPNYKFIVAPHEVTEKHMLKIEHELGNAERHSKLNNNSGEKQVLIIDSIGKLSRLYRLADFAYVGGGFSDGIHNILEPAVYNVPIFFGNLHYKKYKEANDLIKLKAAIPIANAKELSIELKKFDSQVYLDQVKSKMANYVTLNKGAAEKVVSKIKQFVPR